MLHVNLLKWRNLIGSLSQDIGQKRILRDGRLVTLIKTDKTANEKQINPVKKCFLVYFSSLRV